MFTRLTGLFLAQLQQVSVRRLWEGAVPLRAQFKKSSSIFICAEGKPGRSLLDAVLRGSAGIFPLLHPEEDEHSGRFLQKVLHRVMSEAAQPAFCLLPVESQGQDFKWRQ